MTFIAGFNCTDGIVLCADQLESDGMTKRYRCKIECIVMNDQWSFAWGASGIDAHVIDKFSDNLKRALKKIDDFNRADIERAVETELTLIHQDHAAQPIEVVAGLWSKPTVTPMKVTVAERLLYRGRSDNQCLARDIEYCIAGMEVTLAAFILRNTFRILQTSTDEALRLGIFVTALMKEYAAGVGGDTNLLVYRIGAKAWREYTHDEIAAIEAEIPIGEMEKQVTAFWSQHRK